MPSREFSTKSREFAGNFAKGRMTGDLEKDPMTGSQSARWVLRATLGKSPDRGEPECFRPARTLREAPSAEDSLLQHCSLGEAGDREICRRGPGAARSAEP